MTTVRLIWVILGLFWIGAEIYLARKNRVGSGGRIIENERRSQHLIWLTLCACLIAALFFKTLAWAPVAVGYFPRQIPALLMFTAGLGIRCAAIKRLGRFFTTNISIQHNHQLVVDGLYRRVRHPAYTGLLIALAGTGLAMGDFIAMLILTVPAYYVFSYRIEIEEKLLVKKFGTEYREYCKRTGKLFPRIFIGI